MDNRFFTQPTENWQSTPAIAPRISAPIGPTKPDAGVIVARPATMPVTMPTRLGLPYRIHS